MSLKNLIATSGPVAFSATTNWPSGAAPANGDDVVFRNSSVDVLGSDETGTTTTGFATLTIERSYLGKIGQFGNPIEVSQTYLKVEAIKVYIGRHTGGLPVPNGSSRIMLDLAAVASTIYVESTSPSYSSAEHGIPSVLLKSNHADTVYNVIEGRVGIAFFAGDTSQQASAVNVGPTAASQFGNNMPAEVYIGAGLALASLKVRNGGYAQIKNAPVDIDIMKGGRVEHFGTGNVTGEIEIFTGGEYILRKDGGTIDKIIVHDGAHYDESKAPPGCIVTDVELVGANPKWTKNSNVTKTNQETTRGN